MVLAVALAGHCVTFEDALDSIERGFVEQPLVATVRILNAAVADGADVIGIG
jgi:hypothetical protein